jgi:hypothetical protein
LTADQIINAAAAYAAKIGQRMTQRDRDTAKIDTSIPEPVLEFLDALYQEPNLKPPDGKDFWTDFRRMAAILAALRAAYRHGCREGYIEGFVARREPDRQRSKTANDAKRKKIVIVAGKQMTREQRDAMMATEYASLRQLMKHTPACQRLAGKYEFESWQGVAAAIKSVLLRPGE